MIIYNAEVCPFSLLKPLIIFDNARIKLHGREEGLEKRKTKRARVNSRCKSVAPILMHSAKISNI